MAQAQRHLDQVTQRLTAVQGELDTILQVLSQAREAVHLVRSKEDLGRLHQADAHLRQLQAQMEALRADVTALEEARQQAAWEITQAQERR